jgi:hypothetical protein
MESHWEIAWTTLQPLTEDEIERSVGAIKRLGCSLIDFVVEPVDDRFVAVRHRQNDEFLLEFGSAADAPNGTARRVGEGHGLIEDGRVAWNWCCTGRRQPETGLLVLKWRQVQAITGDKLLVWDDDGLCHWSWGSCPLQQVALDPMAIVDAHLHPWRQALAS